MDFTTRSANALPVISHHGSRPTERWRHFHFRFLPVFPFPISSYRCLRHADVLSKSRVIALCWVGQWDQNVAAVSGLEPIQKFASSRRDREGVKSRGKKGKIGERAGKTSKYRVMPLRLPPGNDWLTMVWSRWSSHRRARPTLNRTSRSDWLTV